MVTSARQRSKVRGCPGHRNALNLGVPAPKIAPLDLRCGLKRAENSRTDSEKRRVLLKFSETYLLKYLRTTVDSMDEVQPLWKWWEAKTIAPSLPHALTGTVLPTSALYLSNPDQESVEAPAVELAEVLAAEMESQQQRLHELGLSATRLGSQSRRVGNSPYGIANKTETKLDQLISPNPTKPQVRIVSYIEDGH